MQIYLLQKIKEKTNFTVSSNCYLSGLLASKSWSVQPNSDNQFEYIEGFLNNVQFHPQTPFASSQNDGAKKVSLTSTPSRHVSVGPRFFLTFISHVKGGCFLPFATLIRVAFPQQRANLNRFHQPLQLCRLIYAAVLPSPEGFVANPTWTSPPLLQSYVALPLPPPPPLKVVYAHFLFE